MQPKPTQKPTPAREIYFFRTRPKADKDRFEEDLATRNDTVLKFAKKFQIEGDLSQETVIFENKIYLSSEFKLIVS